jgi:enoyl-CoA hydratase/carnithine racemase
MNTRQQPNADTSPLEVRREGSTAWLTMRRAPDNKLELELTRALYDALTDADNDRTARSIVLTGSFGVFCGGADLPAIRETDTVKEFAEALADLFGVFPELKTPVIAAVNGDALAGGYGLACSADIVVAVDGAKMGTIEAKFGSWPALAQVAALQRTPFPMLVSNVHTGEPFTAQRAERFGIVDEIVAPDTLSQRAAELAEAAAAAGDALAIGRRALYRARDLPYRDALREGVGAFIALVGGSN